MKNIKKFFTIFVVLVLMLFANDIFAADWTLVEIKELPVGFRFEYGSYAAQNFLATDVFIVQNNTTGQRQRTYCIQQRVLTEAGTQYNLTEFAMPASISEMRLSDQISAFAYGDGGNTAEHYYMNVLNEKIRKSFNIAYMWERMYYPDQEPAMAATAWFIWCQGIGYASQYMESYRGGSTQTNGIGTQIEDGYRYLDMNYGSFQNDPDNDGIFSEKGLKKPGNVHYHVDSNGNIIKQTSWDFQVTEEAAQRYIELINYYQNFSDTPANLSKQSKVLLPGDSFTFTDSNSMIKINPEWTLDTTGLPAGITAQVVNGGVKVDVSPNFQGYYKGTITLKRFEKNNTQKIGVYSNGQHQILYNGALPIQEYDIEVEAASGKIRLSKMDVETGAIAQGDATLVGAKYEVKKSDGTHTEIITIGENLQAETGWLSLGTYYVREVEAPEGYNLSTTVYPVSITADNVANVYIDCTVLETTIKGDIAIYKKLGETDYDPQINLAGSQFKATLISDRSKVYYSNISGADGVCRINSLPYGLYEVEECIVPPEAEKIDNFQVEILQNNQTYTYTKVDDSKDMRIEVIKQIKVNAGEKTDAVVSGAEFTVYRDAACTDKVCVIGPTDANGYAISGKMRTGTYYLKETKFPTGIDPDATIPGENVTYRNKVYSVTYDNRSQGTETVTVSLTVQNEPKRNDLEIFKEIGKTSNTPQFPLDQCEFTATLKSSIGTDQVFSRKCTAETDKNGYCIIEDLPYGEYVVEETKVSPISLKCENFEVFIKEDQKVQVEPYYKNIVDTPKVMQIKIRKVDANRKDTDPVDFTQGDAVLEGAIYQIFRYDPQTDDYTEAVYEITVDHKDSEGYWCAESKDLLVGKYMVKEKISYTEVVDGKTINYSYAEGYLADPNEYYFEQQPNLQTVERTYQSDISKEEVIRGRVEVIKYDNQLGTSDEKAAEGAILRLTLNSDSNKYYDVTINENGYGEFVEEESREKYYPYTIPYGEYTITEVKESNAKEHTSFFIHPEPVTISKQVQKEYRIESDEPVQMYIRIQKTDKDTGANVALEGAKFKVWNCQTDEWVNQMTYPSGTYVDEFTTNEEGILTLPHKLEAGEYIIYETQAPAGYYFEDGWRIPANEADIGDASKGGKYVKIDKAAMDVVENTTANTIDLFYKVEMPNTPLKGKLEIFKTGEKLSEVSMEPTVYGEKITPVYKNEGLAGVTYQIKAAEDIKSPDGRVTYVQKGTIVDTITTGTDGIATTKDLYLGEYEIEEIVTPIGYIKDDNIENVILENEDCLVKVETTNKELNNVRQKLKLTFIKEYKEASKYVTEKDNTKWAVFGVYANEDIRNSKGNIVIAKDSLLDVIRIEGENVEVTSNIDLPQGKYYVKELDASSQYKVNPEPIEVTLQYVANNVPYITVKLESTVINEPTDSGNITLIKVSSSSLGSAVVIEGEIDDETTDETLRKIINDLKGLTEVEVKTYLETNNIKTIAGVEYSIYVDKDCTKPLYEEDETTGELKEVVIVTDESGFIKLEEIPLGKYYLKETNAPEKYVVSGDIVEVDLTLLDKNGTVYQVLSNDSIVSELISKTDIFTGETIDGCVFKIEDENGKVLVYSKTCDGGKGTIPVDLFEDGKTYTYTEIEAPSQYKLNTEPHKFVAEFDEDGNWITKVQPVENLRNESQIEVIKKDFADSKPLANCKFELRSLETDFVAEGITDENGVCVFKNVPYGKYTYTEIEAPEGYIIDTESHEITIDAEKITIEITNERVPEPPETGDIQIDTIAGILVISVVGMLYVSKNKKQLVK